MVELYKGKNNKSYFVGEDCDEVLKVAKDRLKRGGIVRKIGYVHEKLLYLDAQPLVDAQLPFDIVWVAYVGERK